MTSKHAVRRAQSYCRRARAYLIPHAAEPSRLWEGSEPAAADLGSATEPPTADAPITRTLEYGQVVYAVELTEDASHYELIQEDDLSRAAMTTEQLHLSALRQLAEFANTRLELLALEDGIWELELGDAWEASLLLIDALWDDVIPQHVGSAFVVAAPTQDCLLIGKTDALARMRERLTERVDVNAPTQSADFLSRVEGRWAAVAPVKTT